MLRFRCQLLATALLLLGSQCAQAEPGPDETSVSRRVDEILAAKMESAGVKPGLRSDDAQFFRRLHLDLMGKVPPVSETRRFLADSSPGKRDQLIERLLNSPRHAAFLAVQYRQLLAPDSENDPTKQAAVAALERWLCKQFAAKVPYDRLARAILTHVPETLGELDPGEPSPRLFYLGREDKPEDLAAATTRLFLGVRLECAQCHDHPFAPWKRDQFWSQAAFFVGLRKPGQRSLMVPGTERMSPARFLDGAIPPESGDVRERLASWVTAGKNPYFAKAAVNRVWAHLFGIGLVDPVDDFGPENQPSHPELLDELSQAFVASGHDLRFLTRILLKTDAYQSSSASPDGKSADPRLFSRMNVKSLTPEQAFDSLVEATGIRGAEVTRMRGRFLSRFSRAENRLDGHTSTAQALAMMNGELMALALDPAGNGAVGAIVASPLGAAESVDTLFLAALGRPPRPSERENVMAHVDRATAAGKRNEALSDVFWALLNSPEFSFNH